MPMLVFQEDPLIYEIPRECDCRDAEAGKGALEAVPAAEWAAVAPCFTAGTGLVSNASSVYLRAYDGSSEGGDGIKGGCGWIRNVLSSPWISRWCA